MFPSRRDALKQIALASAGAALAPCIVFGQGDNLVVAGQPVDIGVSLVNDVTLRVVVRARSGGSDAALADGALVRMDWGQARAVPADGSPASLGGFRVSVTAAPGPAEAGPYDRSTAGPTLIVASASAAAGTTPTRWQTLQFEAATGAMTFDIADVPLLGFGEGGPNFDRRGVVDRMRSGQGGFDLRTHGGRVPVQWLIGRGAVFIHQPLGAFDLTPPHGRFTPPADARLPIDLFVVGSEDPAAILKSLADITGYAELPPRWSFGYLQSHRTLAGPDEVLSVAKTFRDKKLPCDALIYLGTDFCPAGWNTHNGEFTWNPATFPHPQQMVDTLHDEHFKVVLHVVLEGRRLTGTVDDPCTAPPLPPGRTPDGQWPPDRQVSCYWPAHKPLVDMGIDGFWPDQGDGLDAPSRLARIRMYWDGIHLYRPGERVFALHRNGYAGMQRYAAFLWSGDVYSLWQTLANHVPIAVNSSLSGIPFWGTDIGGFVPTAELTGELFVRWFQFGAFCPLFRAHGRTWHLRLPWGWNTGELGVDEVSTYTGGAQDPPPSELHNAKVEPICRTYLELRYRMLPYTYTAVRECHDTGLPIIRAMWIHYPHDAVAAARGDQYLWGRDILVAPVVEKGATSRRVYLPGGAWHDFWTEERLDGGREVDAPVDLETMPIYVRAGAIVPLGPIKQYADEPSDAPTELVVYPGADGAFTLYEDDGRTLDYQGDKGVMRLDMRWENAARRLTIELAPGSTMRPPAVRPFDVRLAGTTETHRVQFSGGRLTITLSSSRRPI